ncbi:hypothetical protein G6F64_005653 [Rhizopus arrhizus]|uniref:Uncharacterized protein n=1 Tax=Rhizopus oryzae TaxID=64495 RepID=A0A9P7BSW1_RHIOR|nr:hypothetical protein G6F64_005653 [Rhizopus arrhizus]
MISNKIPFFPISFKAAHHGEPEGIREILDETPTSDLKDDIKRFKKHVPKYNHDEWTRTPQINKEFTNELKEWKVVSFQVVTSIIKHAEEARIQARTSTEIFELLESIEKKCRFEDEGAPDSEGSQAYNQPTPGESGSHIDALTEVQVKKLQKKKNAPAYENNNINALSNRFKKIVNSESLKVALNSCENYKPTTPVEHVVNRIYLFVLRTHVERPWVFSSENLKRYSEFDLQVKFWGYIFELYLGQHRHLTLSFVSPFRGDTMSNTCKNMGLRFKLDLRVLILSKDEMVIDGATGEIARKATKAKLYTDRLKSVLTTKCHLNAFLKSLRYISEEDIMNVQMPIVQVMGLEAKVSSLRLIAKKKYAMEDLHSFKFPQTSEQLKSGELQTLINGLTLIEIVIYSQVISPNTSTLILD